MRVLVAVLVSASFVWMTGPRASGAEAAKAPYPPSPVIERIEWDFKNVQRQAPGSDNWPVTWADDDHQYTVWGDGGGFGGTNSLGRASLGLARVEGDPPDLTYLNILGGHKGEVRATFPGKANGLLCVDGTLYMGVTEQDKWLRAKIGKSTDHGRTWTFASENGQLVDFDQAPWTFAEPDGAFSDPAFLNFGRNYAGARDDHVYVYSQDRRAQKQTHDVALFRVPKARMTDRAAYEYFAGCDAAGGAQWRADIGKRKPAFSDPNTVGWGVRVAYIAQLKRYLLTTHHDERGGWGVFDAPEPWGPWTTVAYYDKWIDSAHKFCFTFNSKWASPDGRTLHMIFSGTGKWDRFSVIRATLTLAESPLSRASGSQPNDKSVALFFPPPGEGLANQERRRDLHSVESREWDRVCGGRHRHGSLVQRHPAPHRSERRRS